MKIIVPSTTTLISSSVAASSYSNWSSATAYVVGNKVYYPSNFAEYECRTANTNLDPTTHTYDPATNPSGEWIFLGTTNRFKMFDQFLNTQTVKASQIIVEFSQYGSMALFLGNIYGDTLLIEVVDATTLEVLETNSYNLYNDPSNWLEYFYGDWMTTNKITSILYERTTLVRDIVYRVTLNSSTDAAIGTVVAGQIKEIGSVQWGFQNDALDYSTILTDSSTGATYLSKGNIVKIITADIYLNTISSEAAYNTLALLSSRACVFYDKIADIEKYQHLYGFIKKVSQVYKGYNETIVKVDLQGLI